MYTLTELQPLLINWAKPKNLLSIENASAQRLKLIEEAGETAKAILKSNISEQKDGLGDMFVVLVILAEQVGEKVEFGFTQKWDYKELYGYNKASYMSDIINNAFGRIQHALNGLYYLADLMGHDLTECANLAYNEIKNRTGQTVNGTFIKN